jgi:transposase-like protein
MSRRGNSEREQYWRGVVRDQPASGLSISEFCRQREVSAASFFRWRRKLGQRQQEDSAAKFVSIELAPPPAHAGQPSFEVVLPDRCRIIVPARFDADSLRELLGVLEDRPC